VPPKFEFFDDRIEMTSFGSLPQGMSEKEFFEGYSVPRNKELMRIFRDLDLVEHLGSGVPRILKSYGKECFKFTENFLRMTFPASEQVTEQVTEQVRKPVQVLSSKTKSANDLMLDLDLKHRPTFLYDYLKPALEQGFIEMTVPDKPNSSLQKYRLTVLGKELKNKR
jgi:predicted HTH transcriptional regulator